MRWCISYLPPDAVVSFPAHKIHILSLGCKLFFNKWLQGRAESKSTMKNLRSVLGKTKVMSVLIRLVMWERPRSPISPPRWLSEALAPTFQGRHCARLSSMSTNWGSHHKKWITENNINILEWPKSELRAESHPESVWWGSLQALKTITEDGWFKIPEETCKKTVIDYKILL